MRVCLVSGEYPPDQGGVADYTRCLAEALAERGVVVDVLARRPGVGSESRQIAGGDRQPGVGGESRRDAGGESWQIAGGESRRDTGGESRRRSGGGSRRGSGGEPRRACMPLRGNGARDAEPAVRRTAAENRIAVFRVAGVWRWSAALALRRMVALTQPDVLHIQYQTAAYQMHPGINVAPWWLRRTESVKLAVTYHDLRVPYLFPKAGRVRRWVTLLPARWSHLALATNAADYGELAARVRSWRLELVPIGSNIPDAPPPDYDRDTWRRAAGIGPDVALVAYFGMLNSSKGARTLVAALAALRGPGRDVRGPGRNVRLAVVGATVGASDPTNRAYQAEVEAEIEARGLADAVIWTGHLPPHEVSAWLRAADVVALPYADGASYRRGSLLAALAHGRPVVTTTPSGVVVGSGMAAGPATSAGPSMSVGPVTSAGSAMAAGAVDPLPPLRDRESARLVPAADPAALASALAEVLDDPALADRLAQGARALAAHFSWDAIALRHESLYREITGDVDWPSEAAAQ